MSRPDRTITCAQVTLVEAADTLETSSVGVEVMPGVGKKNYAAVGIFIHWNLLHQQPCKKMCTRCRTVCWR